MPIERKRTGTYREIAFRKEGVGDNSRLHQLKGDILRDCWQAVEIQPDLLTRFQNITYLLIGDMMQDECLSGHIQRISLEAPVPILCLAQRVCALGGTANVVKNLRTLGAKVMVLGVVDEDATGQEILKLPEELGVNRQSVRCDPSRLSSRKTRLTSVEHGQQLIRMDEESTRPIGRTWECALLNRLNAMLPNADVVLCSGDLEGVITGDSCKRVFD